MADEPTLSIVIRQDFTHTITQVDPGPPQLTEIEDGTFTVGGSVFTIIPTGAPEDAIAFTMQVLTATDMTLFVAEDVFDFNEDGTETPATRTAIFVKR